jgi:hypothetical protein
MDDLTIYSNIANEKMLTNLGDPALPGPQQVIQQCITCTEVMDPFFVVVILSCMLPMSVARVGW